jgi:hypothetical protein
MHEVGLDLPLVLPRIQPPKLLPDLLLKSRMRKLVQTALLLPLDDVRRQLVRHFLRSHYQPLPSDRLLNVLQQVVLKLQLVDCVGGKVRAECPCCRISIRHRLTTTSSW